MSTYNSPTDLNPLTKARSVDINAFDAAVGDAFSRIPLETDMTNNNVNYGVDAGSANMYVVTLPVNATGLVDGLAVVFSPLYTNTGASALNVSGLGSVGIRLHNGMDTRPGDIVAGVPIEARFSYVTGYFHITGNPALAATSTLTLPVEDGSPLLQNTGDPSKKVQFDLARISTGTTRTLIVPDRTIVLGKESQRVTRTANVQLVEPDLGKFFDVTSGTFTQTFAAASVLRDGWVVWYRNSGTGDVTVSSADLIDGLASYVMYPGEARAFYCNGTTFTSVIISAFAKTFIAAGSFIKPPGYRYFGGLLWGGGASGSKGNISNFGGCGGGCFPFTILAGMLAASTAVVIGSGGAASTSAVNPGSASSFGPISVNGGSAAAGGGPTGLTLTGTDDPGGFGGGNRADSGAGSPARASFYGGAGAGQYTSSPLSSNNGASSVYGGAGGGAGSPTPTNGGTSIFGGNGGNGGNATSGTDGVAPGGGGGGTNGGATAGAGARGELQIWGIV